MTHLRECYDTNECDCVETIAGWRDERIISDARGEDIVRVEAFAEAHDRDWQQALADEDWRTNQCTGHDQFGARCLDRESHTGKHGATWNERLKFAYSPKLLEALVYTNNPLLRMVPR